MRQFVGAFLLSAAACTSAAAVEHRFDLLLDTDNDPVTGCVVAEPTGSIGGIEQVTSIYVDTSTSAATVNRITQRTCTQGTLGTETVVDSTGWPVGLGDGSGGVAVIEAYIARNALPASGTMRVTTASSSNGSGDVVPAFTLALGDTTPPGKPAPAIPVPLARGLSGALALLLSAGTLWWHRRHPRHTALLMLAVLCSVSTLLWAATVVLDGNVGDWVGIAPSATDPKGDAPIDTDIVAVYTQRDAVRLYFRIDADVRLDTGVPTNTAPSVSAGADQTITLPAMATLAGTVTDDGLPNPPAQVTVQWTAPIAPAPVVFANSAASQTTATFTQAGQYTLRLTASDSALTASSDTHVLVMPAVSTGPTFAPISDRTIAVGVPFQQVLVANSDSPGPLVYSLPTAPPGAALAPSPLVAWTPDATQVGSNTFTAMVSDSANRTATTTFHVTVVYVDHPPQLGPQPDVSLTSGTPFTRVLTATDPDANDTLAFTLVAGPPGMALAGSTLAWSTTGFAPGTYAVTVRVTDASGQFDTRVFNILLTATAPPPVANDDHYSVRLGETLALAAPGVLANDVDPAGGTLLAQKLTDPDKGTLNAFAADGSFSFTAPSVPAGPAFTPVVKWSNGIAYWNGQATPVVADVFANGKPVVFAARSISEGGVTAIDGATGTSLWTVNGELPAPNAGCYIQATDNPDNQTADNLAVGDIDDSGLPAVVTIAKCLADANQGTRMIALDARTGAVKWLTPPLGALIPNSGGVYFGMAFGITPLIARLHANETPSVLFKVEAEGYLDNPPTLRACDQFQPNSGLPLCTGVMVLDGADGSVRHRFIAPTDDVGRENFEGGQLMVADLTGSGAPNIVANGAVWDADGNLISNRLGALPHSIALAKLDDSGQVSIISYEIGSFYQAFIVARHADGTVQWQTPIDASTVHGLLSVADLDGDGSPEIMATSEGNLYVYDAHGQIKWTHRYADASNLRTIDFGKRPAAFDLDGDGVAEVIVPTSLGLEFTDGKTGKTKAVVAWPDLQVTNEAGYDTALRVNAIVADIDGSGHASIVLVFPAYSYGDSQYVVAIKSANDDWRPAPTVFNEYGYHVANVDNVGHIPAVEVNNFATPRTNVYGAQAQAQPPVDPRLFQGTAFTYAASNGTLTSQPATVAIDIAPQDRPPVFTSTPPTVYVPVAFTYAAHATDPDPGDTVTYSLLLPVGNGAGSCSIDAGSGLVTCVNLFAGDQFFTVVATDSQGASAFQSVHMTQSAGSASVPSIVGELQPAAMTTLAAAGFTLGNVNAISSSQPAGQVLSQAPAAGATAVLGEAVAVTESSGPAPTAVPFVIGDTLQQATAQLTPLGFTTAVTLVASTTTAAGQVIDQSPVGGTMLVPIPANPVMLDVSSGAAPTLTNLASIDITPGAVARLVGEDSAFKANGIYASHASADFTYAVTWTSSQPTVATIDATGIAHAVGPGSTTVTASAGAFSGQATLTVLSRTTGDIVDPVALITAPTGDTTVTSPTAIIGTATDANFLRYELALAPGNTTDFTLIGEGTNPVTAGTLGTLDPTLLLNGAYTLQLTVYDTNLNTTIATASIIVDGSQKVGNFTLAYTDLTLPLAGVPIQVTRLYDSRNKQKGDFGIGWTLGLKALQVASPGIQGEGWTVEQQSQNYVLTQDRDHFVTVAAPSGRVETFDLVLTPSNSFLVPFSTLNVSYVARAGTVGTLQTLDNANVLITDPQPGPVTLIDDTTLDTFDPDHFLYTQLDGTQYVVSRANGVQSVRDTNGNQITLTPGGITHSSGASVTFVRDTAGRITGMTDPQGHLQSYAYSSTGDLVSHTDATGSTTRYYYNTQHGIVRIEDPSGNAAVRSDYDEQGRLVAITDANGNTVTYTHDLPGRQDQVTDALGHVSVLNYDERGNVLASTDPLGNTTTYAYDATDNQVSRVDPDGVRVDSTFIGIMPASTVVDPAGLALTKTYAYDAMNDPVSVTDAGGRTITLSYDGNRNIAQLDAPGTGTLTTLRNAQGLAIGNTDAVGTMRLSTRDGAGNVTREDVVDASSNLLRRTDYTYDANGNMLTTTLYRDVAGVTTPLTTTFTYDDAARVTSVTDPAGGITRQEYDALGRQTAVVDPLGRRTSYAYDDVGRVLATTFADGTSETAAYDVVGNLVAQTDRAGRITTYTYDAANRRVKTTLPDGSVLQTLYSPAGRVMASIDGNGNRTDFGYDSAGRHTTTSLPPVLNGVGGPTTRPQVTMTLNAVGATSQVTDANGHQTAYAYDAAGRPVQTTFADGSTSTQAFDALGHRTSVTNEEGQSTVYSYDGLGRLVGAQGLAGNATYAYDQAGNLVKQTDALGRVTALTYDVLNRTTRKTYPGGETEQVVYDAVGNVVGTTDPNGKTTAASFDTVGRPIRRDYPDSSSATYTWAPDGQRLSSSDANGTTTRTYDARGQLATETKATGDVISYSYDANGNLLTLASPAATLTNTYDALDRLVQVSGPEGQAHYFYDLAGNRVRLANANGVLSDATYDVRNRPTLLTHKTAGGVVLESFANVYSASGRRSQVTELDGSQEHFGFDAQGRVISDVRTGTSPFTIAHSYDAVGNRVQTVRNGATTNFSYDTDDHLVSDGTSTYAWDANGNLVNRGGTSTATQYAYDAQDHLVGVTGPAGEAQYSYDTDGNRIGAMTGTVSTRFLVDTRNNTGLPQVLEERDGGGALLARYSYGNERLAMSRSGVPSFYLADIQGNVRALSGAGQTVTDSYRFDDYGRTIGLSGATDNPYRYGGERMDATTGLYDLRARDYDPSTGRFQSRDPFGGHLDTPSTLHRYTYGAGDPVNNSDPTGRDFTVQSELETVSIGETVDTAEFSNNLSVACRLKQTLYQIDDYVFLAEAAVGFATVVSNPPGQWATASTPAFSGAGGIGATVETTLFDIGRENASAGDLSRLAFGKLWNGYKLTMEQSTGSPNQGLRTELEYTTPPFTVKGASGVQQKLLDRTFGCPFRIGEFYLEAYAKASAGASMNGKLGRYAGEVSAGVSAGVDAKLDLLGGSVNLTLPLFGVEGSVSETGGYSHKTTAFGLTLTQ